MHEAESTCTALRDGRGSVRMPPSRTGFSLVELLIVIGIIASLVSILIPTIAKARESAIRVQCASNLRQCGIADRMYANDNDGWLILRRKPYPAEVERITALNGGCMAVPLSRYAPASIWFCPNFRSINTSGSTFWNGDEKALSVKNHNIGYAVFGAYWDAGSSQVLSTSPWWGVDTVLDGGATKITNLKPYRMRMSEWFLTNPSKFVDKPLVFHHSRRFAKADPKTPRPDGGNILMGDGSVQWSPAMWKDFGFSDSAVYAMPPHFDYWK